MPRISRCCLKVSQRWLAVVLIFIGILNLYGMRVCLSIAITVMASPHNYTKKISDDTCWRNSYASNNTHANLKKSLNGNRYDWSEYTQGLILSSFYLGYILSNILGGMLSQKFGSIRVLGLSILLTSTLTLLTPHCTIWTGSTGLIVLRLAMGIAEGPSHPALSDLLAHWIPQNERPKAGSVIYSSIPLGAMYGVLLSGVILQHSDGGWPMVFYFYGTSGLVSFLLIVAFCYSKPDLNPFISDEELSYLHSNLNNTHTKRPMPPWRHMLKSLPIWALFLASIGQTYGITTVMSDMPKFISSVLKISVQDNGIMSSVPYLSMWIAGSVFSWVANKLITTETISITGVRKIGCATGTYGFAVFIIAAAHAGCNDLLVTGLLTLGFACYSANFSSSMVNSLDLSPNFASTITGLTNGLSTVICMLAPYIIGIVTTNQTISEWRIAFWIVFGVMVVSNTFFVIYGSAELQKWNDPDFLSKTNTVNENEIQEAVDLLHTRE